MARDLYTIRLIKHTGYLIMWSNDRRTVSGTAAQLRVAYGHVLRHNLLFGWWSPASVIVNPYVLFMNYRTRRRLDELVRADFGTII